MAKIKSTLSNLLNVRQSLEHVVWTCEDMLARDGKYPGGLVLAPIDRANLSQMKLLARSILRKHSETNARNKQRKDVYVNQPTA